MAAPAVTAKIARMTIISPVTRAATALKLIGFSAGMATTARQFHVGALKLIARYLAMIKAG